jgi:hypothetical protein
VTGHGRERSIKLERGCATFDFIRFLLLKAPQDWVDFLRGERTANYEEGQPWYKSLAGVTGAAGGGCREGCLAHAASIVRELRAAQKA